MLVQEIIVILWHCCTFGIVLCYYSLVVERTEELRDASPFQNG